MTKFTEIPNGSKIIDIDGRAGYITKVTDFEGIRWYDVRFTAYSTAVRYPSDIASVIATPSKR